MQYIWTKQRRDKNRPIRSSRRCDITKLDKMENKTQKLKDYQNCSVLSLIWNWCKWLTHMNSRERHSHGLEIAHGFWSNRGFKGRFEHEFSNEIVLNAKGDHGLTTTVFSKNSERNVSASFLLVNIFVLHHRLTWKSSEGANWCLVKLFLIKRRLICDLIMICWHSHTFWFWNVMMLLADILLCMHFSTCESILWGSNFLKVSSLDV